MALDDYFSKNYTQDGETLWYRSHLVDDVYYCFMMKDWNATLQVLQDKDKFKARCGMTLSNLGFLRQIHNVNTASGFHESMARKLKMAGSAVAGNLSDIYSQIQSLKHEVDRGFSRMDRRIDAQQKDIHLLNTNVINLHDCVQNQSHALLAMQDLSILQERKMAIDTSLMHKSLLFNMMTEEEKGKMRAEVEELQKQRKEVEKEMEDLRAVARGFAVPSLPPLNQPTPNAQSASSTKSQPSLSQTPQLNENNAELLYKQRGRQQDPL